jgi:hypothetical protein
LQICRQSHQPSLNRCDSKPGNMYGQSQPNCPEKHALPKTYGCTALAYDKASFRIAD